MKAITWAVWAYVAAWLFAVNYVVVAWLLQPAPNSTEDIDKMTRGFALSCVTYLSGQMKVVDGKITYTFTCAELSYPQKAEK